MVYKWRLKSFIEELKNIYSSILIPVRFEFYGIRYRREGSSTAYLDFNTAVEESYEFCDTQYIHFPYDGEIDVEIIDENGNINKKTQKSGVSVYDRLRKTYTMPKVLRLIL